MIHNGHSKSCLWWQFAAFKKKWSTTTICKKLSVTIFCKKKFSGYTISKKKINKELEFSLVFTIFTNIFSISLIWIWTLNLQICKKVVRHNWQQIILNSAQIMFEQQVSWKTKELFVTTICKIWNRLSTMDILKVVCSDNLNKLIIHNKNL